MDVPLAEIRPSVKKAFISNILFISGIVILIIAILLYLNAIVGLDIFLDSFKEIGVIISPQKLLMYSIFAIVSITVLMLLLNYVTLSKVYYTLYQDKIKYSKSLFIVQVKDQTIPYPNIARVSYKKKAFLNTSKITIDLTGMKENKVEIDFVDDVEDVVRKIQDLMREFRARYYAQYTQDYRMNNIMGQF